MKRILYLASSLVLLGSFSLYGGRTFAAHLGSSANAAALPVQLCSSLPIGVPGDAHIVRGIWNGVELAVTQWRPKFKAVGMTLLAPKELNSGKADGSAVDPDREASNAHTCVDDANAIAAVQTLNSSMAQVSEPILDRAGMAMVSPSNSNPILTSPVARGTYEPLFANHTLKFPTYYRVVTTDNLQGAADAVFMGSVLKTHNMFVVDDGQTYGVGLAQSVVKWNAAHHLGLTQVGTGRVNTSSASEIAQTANSIATQIAAKKPQIVFCGGDEPNCYPVEKAARRDGYTGWFMGGDALFDPSYLTFVGPSQTNNTAVSFFGLQGSSAPAKFKSAYRKLFPSFQFGPYDGLAYDATNVVLNAIYLAKTHGKLHAGMKPFGRRASILRYIKNTPWNGVAGSYKFDKNGDIQNRFIFVYKSVVSGGSAHFALEKVINNLPKSLHATP